MAPLRRRSSGAITPTIKWILYADDSVAPLRRRSGGAITPTMKWLLFAADSHLDPNGRQCAVTLADGQVFLVDRVVLAFGHFPSNEPRISDPAFYGSQRYLRDPWNGRERDAIPPDARTLLLGSGLTAIDVATTLLNRSTGRHISILSRHGLLPKTHRTGPVSQTHIALPDTFDHATGNVRQQLRAFRACVATLANQGTDWREVLNALRPRTPHLWQALPESERKRFLRHVLPHWDNHRHRAAPASHQRFESAIDNGAIHIWPHTCIR